MDRMQISILFFYAYFSLHVDKSAARNSGRAVLEFKFTTHSSTFPNGTRVAILTPIATRYTLQPVNSVATICDEKDNYRFGFNGQEKDNEVRGLGNSLDFGARIYDSRLGRWMSRDGKQIKFPGYSPYNFTLNNPIIHRDPDGKDVEVCITRNSAAGGVIKLNSTVFVSGSNAATVVAQSNKAFGEWKNTGGTYTDKDGNKWQVEVQMTFKVASAEDIDRIKNARSEQAGENLINSDYNGRAYANARGSNYRGGGKFHTTGNMAFIKPTEGGRTSIHENLHLIGLGDRYTDVTYDMKVDGVSIRRTDPFSMSHVGFDGDIMSNGWGMSQTHIDNLGSKALEVSQEKGSDEFIMGRKADNSESSPSTTDKVPSSFKSGNIDYSDPQYEKVK